MKAMAKRIDALEERGSEHFAGPAIWLVLNPGETDEQGIARYEAKHGPRLPGQPAVVWRVIETGVPRGEDSFCA